ncbi:MAG: four helix bundle protein [Phycisphaerae bacterium]
MASRSSDDSGSQRARKPEIRERSFLFALRIIRLTRALGKDIASQTIARQLIRSGTSVGANIEEAQGSHSRADFARRMNIARSEAREALYWLRLLDRSELVDSVRLQELLQESEEIVKILVAIVKTTRGKRVDA